ncbi:MAG: protein kinase, partial [Planctomycetales bacterium]
EDTDRAKNESSEPAPESIGRYRVERLHAEGAFGKVYAAHDESLTRRVAVKVPHRSNMARPEDAQAYLDEARAAALLDHPNIVPIYDFGRTEDGVCYTVSKFIEGSNLQDQTRKVGMSFAASAELISQIAEAVQHAHQRGLVHRDVKPANILIDSSGTPFITDFGSAMQYESPDSGPAYAGTPAYMSPEQTAGGARLVDGRSDLWSLGVVLYELLVGDRPFRGRNVREVFRSIQHEIPRRPRTIKQAIPPELERICLKCLAKPLSDRYESGRDLARDLREFVHGDTWREDESSSQGANYRVLSQSNLPANDDAFIGRKQELEEASALFGHPERRLITLSGPGGAGKTRLALELARRLEQDFPGGRWFVDLRAARTAEEIAETAARALGLPTSRTDRPEQVIASVLQWCEKGLLILDGFEHLTEHAEGVVGSWRRQAPNIWFLVVSQSVLSLPGEREYHLGPLSVAPPLSPLDPTQLREYDDVNLFVTRAAEAKPDFDLTPDNAATVAELCAELEGHPLAIELAAARVSVLSPKQILERLKDKFEFLAPVRNDGVESRSLLQVFESSHDRLTQEEEHVFHQASVFRDGFFLDAAEAVITPAEVANASPILDVLQRLREKSLLRVFEVEQETRFAMYRATREFAELKWNWETWAEQEEQFALNKRHADYFLSRAEDWNRQLESRDAREALDRLILETGNLSAIQDWALAADENETAARAILALARALAVRCSREPRIERLEQSFAALDDQRPDLKTRLATELCVALRRTGDWDRARGWAQAAVKITRRLEPSLACVSAICQQAVMLHCRGRHQEAAQAFEEAESLAQELGENPQAANVLLGQSLLLIDQGDLGAAWDQLGQCEKIIRGLGDSLGVADVLLAQAKILVERRRLDQAVTRLDEAERIAQRLGNLRGSAETMLGRAAIFDLQGDGASALRCCDESEGVFRDLDDRRAIG